MSAANADVAAEPRVATPVALPNGLPYLLGGAHGATRAQVLLQLQRQHGNAYVDGLLTGIIGARSPLPGSAHAAGPNAAVDYQRVSTTAPAIQRQPAAPASPPPVTTLHAIVHEHHQLTEDFAQVQAVIEQVIVEQGWQEASAWAYRFINAEPTQDFQFSPNLAQVGRVRERVRNEIRVKENAVKQLTGDATVDLGDVVIGQGDFPHHATQNTKAILDESERQVKAEAARYGLKISGYIFKDYSMGGGLLRAGLQGAAGELSAKRRGADAAGKTFLKAQEEAAAQVRQNPFLPDQALAKAEDQARAAWVAQEDAYHALSQEKQRDYPILAAYSTADDAATQLAAVATQSSAQLAENLYKTIDDRLKNIQTVRDAIGERYNIWTQPQMVALTKKEMGLKTWESRVVDEKARKVKADAAEDAKVWAALALGLGLLAAIPTGGTSVLAGVAAAGSALGAAYSLHTLYEHYKDYELASAETGTDLDKAKAIAQDAPDLQWLAQDLLDLGLAVVGARSAFKTLREAIIAAETSRLARLPEVIEQCERAGLSVESRTRLVSYVVQRGGGTQTVQESLQTILDTYDKLVPTGDAALTNAYQQAAAKIMQQGRVGIYKPGLWSNLTGEALDEIKRVLKNANPALGEPDLTREAKAVARSFKTNPGQAGAFFPNVDIIILREGADPAIVLAHELAHRAQFMEGQLFTIGRMRAEFQAFSAERQFLLHLPVDQVPASYHWLLFATDADLEQHVLLNYRGVLAPEALSGQTFPPLNPQTDSNLILTWLKQNTAKGKM